VLAFRNATLAIERWSPKVNFIVASLRIELPLFAGSGANLLPRTAGLTETISYRAKGKDRITTSGKIRSARGSRSHD